MGFSEPLRFRNGCALRMPSPALPWTVQCNPHHGHIPTIGTHDCQLALFATLLHAVGNKREHLGLG